jgi:hypothetical protein
MWDKDKVWFGLIIGLIVPFMAYGIILLGYEQLDAAGITDGASMGDSYRARTVGLLAMATNIIPINIFKRRYQIHNMRGIVIATMIYVLLWIYLYYQYF